MSILDTKQKTKDQHIVPKRHLKNFAIFNSNKLECLNVDALRIEKNQSPESICKGYFYYALEPGIEDEYSQMVENNFNKIEDWYGKNIDRIEKQLISKQLLSNTDKYAISWIIANFYFRGYKHRHKIKKVLADLMDWLNPIFTESIHRKILKDYPEKFSKVEEAKKILHKTTKEFLSRQANNTSYATSSAFDEGFANILTHKKWQILINNSNEYPFITGDEAVIETTNDQIPKDNFSQSFLFLTHLFHLSPKIAIIASYPFDEKMHGQVVFEDITENIQAICKNNLLYANYTYKYCYAPNKLFFDVLIKSNKK